MLLIGMAKILISKDGDRLFPLARMYSSELFMANGRQKDGCGLATRRLSLSIKVCISDALHGEEVQDGREAERRITWR